MGQQWMGGERILIRKLWRCALVNDEESIWNLPGIYDLQYQAKSLSWMVAPRDCQTCDEVCAEHGQVCDASHLGPILTEGEVTRNAEKAGFKCTNFYRETWAWTEWDGPLLGMRPGMCVYNGNPSWKPSCSRRPACGYGHRLCPCEDRNVWLRR